MRRAAGPPGRLREAQASAGGETDRQIQELPDEPTQVTQLWKNTAAVARKLSSEGHT